MLQQCSGNYSPALFAPQTTLAKEEEPRPTKENLRPLGAPRPWAANAARKGHVLWHDCDSLGVQGTEHRVLKQADEKGLRRLLQGEDGDRAPAEVCAEILGDCPHEALERHPADGTDNSSAIRSSVPCAGETGHPARRAHFRIRSSELGSYFTKCDGPGGGTGAASLLLSRPAASAAPWRSLEFFFPFSSHPPGPRRAPGACFRRLRRRPGPPRAPSHASAAFCGGRRAGAFS